MKKTGKAFVKILAIALALCVLLGAFPVMSVSAETEYSISFNFNRSYGNVRKSHNYQPTPGADSEIFVFPDVGIVAASLVITDVTNEQTIEYRQTGKLYDPQGNEIGFKIKFVMPEGNVVIDTDFQVDNANGYYSLNYEIIGGGSAKFWRNGFNVMYAVAHVGDNLIISDIVPDKGYIYEDKSYYTNPDGRRVEIDENVVYKMPENDITITVEFTKAYIVNVSASGGTATVHRHHPWFWLELEQTLAPAATEGTLLIAWPAPDENHLNDYDLKVVSASGEEISFDRNMVFRMPAEDITVYVSMRKASYDVACSAENGTVDYIAPDGTAAGKEITLDLAPNEGFGLRELYYTYTPFAGLDPVRVEINPDHPVFTMPQADVNVNAVFAEIRRAQWLDGDGSVLDQKTYLNGDPIPETDKIPTKESTWECDYAFAEWSAPTYYTGNLTVIRPVFDKIYTVNISGGTAEPAKAKAGTPITLTPGDAPTGMYCSGWRVMDGDVEVNGNSFVMPESHVSIYATYAPQKNVDIDFTLSAEKGYVGKPFAVSGAVCVDDEIIGSGGTMTITFSKGTPDAEGAVSCTVPVENGRFALNVPSLTAETDYIWLEYSGYAEYGTALVSDTFRVYSLSAAGLDGFYGENSTKIHYNAGEALNTENLLIWLYWMDGTHEEIPVTPDMVSGFDATRSGWQTLTVACPYPTDSDLTYEVYVRGVYLGDANGDSTVDIRDVTAIQRHLAELALLDGVRLLAADANQDGELNISDATHLQMHLAELFDDSSIGTVIG